MEKLRKNKPVLMALALVLILIVSFGLELLVFNGRVLTLPEEQQGMFELDFARLDITGLEETADGSFVPNGEAITFAVDDTIYIHRLWLQVGTDSSNMHIIFDGCKNRYDIDTLYKDTTIMTVNRRADDVVFTMTPVGDMTGLEVQNVIIDNTVVLNYVRMFFMVSVGVAIAFFLVFRELAATKLHISFLVLALTVGLNYALATPLWTGYDEEAHFIRAYQVAHLNIGTDPYAELDWIEGVPEFFHHTGFATNAHNSFAEREQFIDAYDSTEYTNRTSVYSTVATYPFVPYFFGGVGIFLAELVGLPFIHTFYAGRMMTVLCYALICALAVKIAKMGKRLLFVVGLLPYALFSAGVYTADTFAGAFSVLGMALYMNMLLAEERSLNWKHSAMFALCVSAVTLCKIPYAPLCALVLSVPLAKYKDKRTGLLNYVLVFAIVALVSVATLLFGADKGIIQWYQEGMSVVGQVKYILFHPFTYAWTMLSHVLTEWTNYLSDSVLKMGYTPEMPLGWAWFGVAVMVIIALFDKEEGNEAIGLLPKAACVFEAVCSWVLVMTALYVSYNLVGASYIDGVQGRYFYPLLLPLLLLLKNRKLALPLGEQGRNTGCYMASGVLGFAAAGYMLVQYCM